MNLPALLLFLLHHTTLKNRNEQNIDDNSLGNGQNIDIKTLGNGQNIDIKTLGNGHSIDISTLARIFTFFEQNYAIVEKGTERQFAVAINVPMEQCQAGFKSLPNDFLTQDISEKVKRDIRKKEDPVYEGTELIAAGVKDMGSYKIHSERLLLNLTEKRPTPPMQDLLIKRKDSCTVLYTLNSPWAGVCLNENNTYNILEGLKPWSEHDSIKALVFKQIWRCEEKRKEVFEAALRNIVKYVPVYRCINENGNENVCYACGGKDNSPIDEHCLPKPKSEVSQIYNLRPLNQP